MSSLLVQQKLRNMTSYSITKLGVDYKPKPKQKSDIYHHFYNRISKQVD